MFAFAGPGYLVAVGYMDPGNWATDLAGGAQVRLHAALGHPDLEPDGDPAAGALRASSASSPGATWRRPAATTTRSRSRSCLWVLCEIAIAACDLAEVHRLGDRAQAAVRHPAGRGASCITALDVLVVLLAAEQGLPLDRGDRRHADRSRSAVCFAIEIVFSQPDRRGRRSAASCRRSRSCANPRCSTSRSASSARR